MLYKPLPQSDGQGARRSIDGKSRRDSVMTMARGLLSDSGKTHADRDIGESVLAVSYGPHIDLYLGLRWCSVDGRLPPKHTYTHTRHPV